MKITILFSYYNRPKLLVNSIKSLLKANEFHDDWELFFCDDGSPIPGDPYVKNLLAEHIRKVTFFNTHMTPEDKVQQGIVIGRVANEFLAAATGDIVITLADDDELVPTYLHDLSTYFQNNPSVMYCWSKVHIFNPLVNKSADVDNVVGPFNSWVGSINPVNKVDTSQVAYRLSCFREHGVRYPTTTSRSSNPAIGNIDGHLFQQLFDKFGECPATDLIAQYKGVHEHQLVWHKKKSKEAFNTYLDEINELGGERF